MIHGIIIALTLGFPVPEQLGRPIAERLELLDQYETYSVIRWPERCYEGARLPMCRDAEYLPCKDLCQEALLLNRAHARWLDARVVCDIDRDFTAWIRANDRLKDWWYAAKDSHVQYYCVIVRRRAIGVCLAASGREAFYACDWPEWIP